MRGKYGAEGRVLKRSRKVGKKANILRRGGVGKQRQESQGSLGVGVCREAWKKEETDGEHVTILRRGKDGPSKGGIPWFSFRVGMHRYKTRRVTIKGSTPALSNKGGEKKKPQNH